MLGYHQRDLLHRSLVELVHPQDVWKARVLLFDGGGVGGGSSGVVNAQGKGAAAMPTPFASMIAPDDYENDAREEDAPPTEGQANDAGDHGGDVRVAVAKAAPTPAVDLHTAPVPTAVTSGAAAASSFSSSCTPSSLRHGGENCHVSQTAAGSAVSPPRLDSCEARTSQHHVTHAPMQIRIPVIASRAEHDTWGRQTGAALHLGFSGHTPTLPQPEPARRPVNGNDFASLRRVAVRSLMGGKYGDFVGNSVSAEERYSVATPGTVASGSGASGSDDHHAVSMAATAAPATHGRPAVNRSRLQDADEESGGDVSAGRVPYAWPATRPRAPLARFKDNQRESTNDESARARYFRRADDGEMAKGCGASSDVHACSAAPPHELPPHLPSPWTERDHATSSLHTAQPACVASHVRQPAG
ncbi:hypothetical protein EON62_04870, partial [archaeon]